MGQHLEILSISYLSVELYKLELMNLNVSIFATWVLINWYFICFVPIQLCLETLTLGHSRSANFWHYFFSSLGLPSLCISQLLIPSPTRSWGKENLLIQTVKNDSLSVSQVKVLWENIGSDKEFGPSPVWINNRTLGCNIPFTCVIPFNLHSKPVSCHIILIFRQEKRLDYYYVVWYISGGLCFWRK